MNSNPCLNHLVHGLQHVCQECNACNMMRHSNLQQLRHVGIDTSSAAWATSMLRIHTESCKETRAELQQSRDRECRGSDLNRAGRTRLNAGDAEGEEGGDEVRGHALNGGCDNFDVFHVETLQDGVIIGYNSVNTGCRVAGGKGGCGTCSTIASSPA